MRSRAVMTTDVVTATPATTVEDAADLLAVRTDEAGAAQLDDPPRDPAVTVGTVMTSPATAMTSGSDVVALIATMETAGIRSMPIVDGTRLVGIVTRRDLARTLARADASGGAVTIRDVFDSDTDRHVATVLGEAVPGVAVVHVEGPEVQ